MTDDELRTQLGALVRRLVKADPGDGREKITDALTAHLGEGAAELPVLEEQLHTWELPNLQFALDHVFAQPGHGVRILGLSAEARHYGLSLGDMIQSCSS